MLQEVEREVQQLLSVAPPLLCCNLQEVEREVQLQISLKQEMEVAVRLLEKDIHEKQDSIVSLRKQLDDIKAINIELYSKQQVSQLPLK